MRSATRSSSATAPVFTADGGITYAKFGLDGSLAVVVDGERLERWDGSSLTTTTSPPELPGNHADPSADNCARALPLAPGRPAHRPRLPAGRDQPSRSRATRPPGPRTGPGSSTSNGVEIEFHRVVGSRREITLAGSAAAQMAWRPDLGGSANRGPRTAGIFGSDETRAPRPRPARGVAASACGGGEPGHEHGAAASVTVTGGSGRFAGGELDPPQPTPDFTLTDQSGQKVSMADQRGKLVLLTFLYTNCPDVCPLITQNLNQALQMLGAKRDDVRVLAVSVDPEGDTPKARRRVREGASPPARVPLPDRLARRADAGLEGLRRRGGGERPRARRPHRLHDARRPLGRGPRHLRLEREGQGRRPRRRRAALLLGRRRQRRGRACTRPRSLPRIAFGLRDRA